MNPMAANTGGSNPMGAPAGPPQGPQGMAHDNTPMPPPVRPPMGQQAQQMQGMGRGEDTQLVHMTPAEVNSLHGLAHHFGGQLTTNPNTGLPEAGWLGKLLPTLIGAGLNFIPGVGPLLSAGLVAAGSTAVTGDLSKGLMAGLQAFGGASMAGALAPGATAGGSLSGILGGGQAAASPAATGGISMASEAFPAVAAPLSQSASSLGLAGMAPGALPAGASAATQAAATIPGITSAPAMSTFAPQTAQLASLGGTGGATAGGLGATVAEAAPVTATQAATTPITNQTSKGILGKFADASRDKMSQGMTSGMIGKAAPWVAGAGLLSTASDLMTPSGSKKDDDDEGSPNPNFKQAPRKTIFDDSYKPGGDLAFGSNTGNIPIPGSPPPVSMRGPLDSRERQYFDVVNPMPGVTPVAETTTPLSASKSSSKKKKNEGFSDTKGWNFAEGGMTGGKGGGQSQPMVSQAPAPQPGMGGGGKGGGQANQLAGSSLGSMQSGAAPRGGLPDYMQGLQGRTQSQSALDNAYGSFRAQGMPQQFGGQQDAQNQFASYANLLGGGQQGGGLGSLQQMAPPPPGQATNPYAQQLQAEQMAQADPSANVEMYQQAQQKLADNPGEFQGPQAQSMAAQAAQALPAPPAGMQRPQMSQWQPPQLSQAGNMGQAAQAGGGGKGGGAPQRMRSRAQSSGGSKGGGMQPQRMAKGGRVLHMESGGHVIPAFDVATYGHGSTNAGQAALRKLGGLPIRGKGDGVSDSIPAKIDRKQPARVADGEVYFPPAAVKKLGGNERLYAMMHAAEKARRNTPSGEKVRGLA